MYNEDPLCSLLGLTSDVLLQAFVRLVGVGVGLEMVVGYRKAGLWGAF